MEDDGNEISLNRLVISNKSDGKVDGGRDDYFPFLALPDKLIGNTFSFLPIKDRMRARVNKRLNRIESEHKYHVDELIIMDIEDINILYPLLPSCENFQRITFVKGVKYSSESIRRLTQNTSIGSLKICLNGCISYFHREVYKLVKDFDIGSLLIRCDNLDEDPDEDIGYNFFIDVAKACTELHLTCSLYWSVLNTSSRHLHQVYKMIMDGSTKLRKMEMYHASDSAINRFFGLIEITFSGDGRFFSKRNIEVFEHRASPIPNRDFPTGPRHTSIFDGNLEISFAVVLLFMSCEFRGTLSFELHESRESLEKAKNREGLVRCLY